MRILHFFKTALPDSRGGMEQVIDQLARGASQRGHAVDVLALGDTSAPARAERDGYVLHRVRRDFEIASTGFSLRAFRRFRQLAKCADVIHYHFPWPFADVVHFVTRAGKPTVLTYHSDVIRQKCLMHLYRPLKRRFLASMDAIVATSPNYLASSDVLQRFADKVTVIPIGIDRQTYATPSATTLDFWRAELPPRFLLFVGVLRYYKGLQVLLEAAAGTGIPVVIVGSGPIEREIKAQAARLNLAHVRFLGFLSEVDKAAVLELCSVVTFPSHLRSEAFGISLLEGAMFGKPMISSQIGTGTSFVNIDGETGIVVPPSDPVALRAAMIRLWNDPEQAAAMGRRAEARYRALFTLEPMVQAYLDLYARVAARS
ncbi:glycosyltransferase family 4 protein [Xanthobacteraceae bacterium Astr-EGSB]|uniref:glycosyltransferase family 4 protein n=1 Tax=Astrobacterium formosum TaxID=3069710 RepID=UPI0027B2EAB9|nr:glycosyltransferase family 4 protein [Xanthobacteraceae bacterium Astr-EGSB]